MNTKTILRFFNPIKIFQKSTPSFFNDFSISLGTPSSLRTPKGDQQKYIEDFTSWVYAAISCIARNSAKVEVKLYAERTKGKRESWERILEHPFLDVWNKPNNQMNIHYIRELTYIYMELLGNAYWYTPKNKLEKPAQIIPLLSQFVKPIQKNHLTIEKYEYYTNSGTVNFFPDEIIHFKTPNPSSLLIGLSPLTSVLTSVDIDKAMQEYSLSLFENGAYFGTTITVPPDMDDTNFLRLQREVQEQFTGVNKAGKTKILRGGQEVKSMIKTMAELAFVEGRRLTKQDILEVYGVPEHKLGGGSTSATSRATAYELDRTFSEETIQPRLRREESFINRFLLPYWDDKVVVEFDDMTPADREFALQEEESRLRTGYYSINQVREMNGHPAVVWGDRPWLPMNMIQVSEYSGNNDEAKQGKAENKVSRYEQVKRNKWHYFVNREEAIERRYIDDLKEFFTVQKKMVQANIDRVMNIKGKKDLVDVIFPPLVAEADRLTEASKKHIRRAVVAGIQIAIEFQKGIFEKMVDTKADIPMPPPEIPPEELASVGFTVASMDTYVEIAVSNWRDLYGFTINKTVQNDLRKLLELATSEGWTIAHIQRDVELLYNSHYIDGMNPVRSLRIARTETARVMNDAELECYQRLGIEYKTWSTALDETACVACASLEMESVKMGEQFSLGVDSPPLHPSCRCLLLAGEWEREE